MKKVLGAGLVAVDHVFLRRRNGAATTDYSYLGSSGGGSVGNTLCLLAGLGHACSISGVVGNDLAAEIAAADFRSFGVDTAGIVRRGGPGVYKQTRQFSHVIDTLGKHTFQSACATCGTEFHRHLAMREADLADRTLTLLKEVDHVHLDRANTATVKLAKAAKRFGKTVSFDYAFEAQRGGSKISTEMLRLADLVKVTDEVLRRRVGKVDKDAVWKFQSEFHDLQYFLVTRGDQGTMGFNRISGVDYFSHDAVPCSEPRDTAGAGDAFVAVMIDQLLLGGRVKSSKGFQDALTSAQAMASLKCTLFGARSLARVLLAQHFSRRQIMEVASNILAAEGVKPLFPPDSGLTRSRVAPYMFSSGSECGVCGMGTMIRKKPAPVRKPRKSYTEELAKGPGAMAYGYEIGRSKRTEFAGLLETPMFFVGSGGSLVAANLGEKLALLQLGVAARALTPYEFLETTASKRQTSVWFLSHGGRNHDIMMAAKEASRRPNLSVGVLTGSGTSPLAALARSHNWPMLVLLPEDRGFVSTVGMLALVSGLVGISSLPAPDLEQFFLREQLHARFAGASLSAARAAQAVPNPVDALHLVALGSGWGWPAVLDLESKVVEGGICTIEFSEAKNYTHGRYINAFYHRTNRHFVLFKSPENAELLEYLNRRLKRHFETTVLETPFRNVMACLDLLIQELFFAYYLGRKAGRELARPRYPPEARGLYGWRPSNENEKTT